nr:P-II family nitrogen regulator [Candidatus Nitrosopumilus sediminis]
MRNSTLSDVEKSLMDISTFSAYQVQITEIHHSHKGLKSDTSDYIPKSKIELLCADKDKEEIISTIQKTANTGQKDDGVVVSYKIDKFGKICDIGVDLITY